MKITSIETIALSDPAHRQDTTVVQVHTDEGISGIGQAESPSLVIEAIIQCSGGLQSLIAGQDPLQVERLWQLMYSRTGLFGRRGVTLAAIGAVETALWDIAGQALGKPVCELIWRSFATTRERAEIKTHVTPYATIYPPGATLDEMQARFETAVQRGFRAMKLEEWPGAFGHGSIENDVAIARKARAVIGPERDLLIDMQNGWSEVGRAVATIRALEPFNIFFIEAPLPPDNLDAYARLADTVDTRIAAGDWGFTSRFEFEELMARGHVDVVQPSSVRSGGMSEILKIAEAAYRRGLLCIPHAWSHMVGVAAEVQLAAVTPNMPYFEYPIAVPDSPIVSELLDPPLVPGADGTIEVPRRPGLGVRLNEETVKRFRVKTH